VRVAAKEYAVRKQAWTGMLESELERARQLEAGSGGPKVSA
jgi:hypothetical protein